MDKDVQPATKRMPLMVRRRCDVALTALGRRYSGHALNPKRFGRRRVVVDLTVHTSSYVLCRFRSFAI